MKERKHGFRVPVPLVLAGLLLAGSWLQPARADAAVAVLEITELWDDGMVYFAVETTYSDIVEFAVGNNDAAGAFIDYGASSPPPSAWWGNIAWQSEGQWYVSGGGIGTRDLNWLENVTDFDNYSFAFFYSSYSSGNYGTPLNPGLTSGFEGTTGGPCSPFAAFDTSAGTITGETTVIPIPAAVWLLGSGLIGLVGLRRRRS